MTLPAIRQNVFPTLTGRRPGFLSEGIKRHAKNGTIDTIDTNGTNGTIDSERLSAVHSFLMT